MRSRIMVRRSARRDPSHATQSEPPVMLIANAPRPPHCLGCVLRVGDWSVSGGGMRNRASARSGGTREASGWPAGIGTSPGSEQSGMSTGR